MRKAFGGGYNGQPQIDESERTASAKPMRSHRLRITLDCRWFRYWLGRGLRVTGYIQEFDFAYKDSSDLLAYQSYLKLVTQTRPLVTMKYSEI